MNQDPRDRVLNAVDFPQWGWSKDPSANNVYEIRGESSTTSDQYATAWEISPWICQALQISPRIF